MWLKKFFKLYWFPISTISLIALILYILVPLSFLTPILDFTLTHTISLPEPPEKVINDIQIEKKHKKSRLMLLAYDGVSLDLLKHFANHYDLPHVRELLMEGRVRRIDPFSNSSVVLWSTYMTGFPPEEHGIESFIEPLNNKKFRLVSRNDLKRPPIWELVHDAGISIGIAGLFVTYPAFDVKRGFLMSDRTFYSDEIIGNAFQNLFSKKKYTSRKNRRRPYENVVSPESLETWLQEPISYLTKLRCGTELNELYPKILHQTKSIPPDIREKLIKINCRSRQFFTRLSERRKLPRLLITYDGFIDGATHEILDFNRDLFSEEYQFLTSSTPSTNHPGILLEIYKKLDQQLGDWLDEVDKDTWVLLVSDHGLQPSHIWEHPIPTRYKHGVVISYRQKGKPPKPEQPFSFLDLAPMILHFFDVDIPESMKKYRKIE